MNEDQLDTYLSGNRQRHQTLFPDYNPFSGAGSPLKRFEVPITGQKSVYLPESMAGLDCVRKIQQAGGAEAAGPEAFEAFIQARMAHDFEFWARLAVTIKGKQGEVNFRLNPPQRKLLRELEAQRAAGDPIRVILLKARQWGGSTLTQIYMAWIQLYHKRHWNSTIVARVSGQAKHIRGMFNHLRKRYPTELPGFSFTPYEGSQSIKYIPERDAIIGVGSIESPDALRSYTFHMLHLSEVGLWKSTPVMNAEDLASALEGALVDAPYTVCVMESTAKGTGNYFHRQWQKAQRGESNYAGVFVAWWEIPEYTRPIGSRAEIAEFIDSWDKYEKMLWALGATLEGIFWYRRKLHDQPSRLHMHSEYPSTAREAFQSTGKRVFSPLYVATARRNVAEPQATGELYGSAPSGPHSLEDIHFVGQPGGNLSLWKKPYVPVPDEDQVVSGRYCLYCDIGGRWEGADYSVIRVLDRYWMAFGGSPEIVATYRGHIDQDHFAWYAARLGFYYGTGLLAVEVNSLTRKHKDAAAQADFSYTILDEIKDYYPNLYVRTVPDKTGGELTNKYGFHMNKHTKPMIVAELTKALRDTLYIERDARAIAEMELFEEKDDGSMGNVEGRDNHDDLVDATAGVVWLSNSYMERPFLRDGSSNKVSRQRVVSEASF